MPTDQRPSQEMLENLDLLLDMDALKNESDWQLITQLDHRKEWKRPESKDQKKESRHEK